MDVSAALKYMNGFVFDWNAPFARWEVPVVTPFVYLLAVFVGVKLMATRTANERLVKMYAVVHSAFLCILSLVMFLGILYGAFLKAQATGVVSLVCDHTEGQRGMLAFWLYVYWLSKFPELLDTAILILRKKQLLFLHVFHHAIMCILPWAWAVPGDWTIGETK